MPTRDDKRSASLREIDSRGLLFPNGDVVRVAATRRYWLAYEELLERCGRTDAELLELVLREQAATGRDPSTCFAGVVACAYAYCRNELAGAPEEETRPPPPATGH